MSHESPASQTVWQRAKFLFKVVEIRLRFILIVGATFVLIGKWDTITNYWDKLTRGSADKAAVAGDVEYFCPMHPTVVVDSLNPDGSIPKCPICSMPLSKRKKGTSGGGDLPSGVTARVQLSPERIQMAGVATAIVDYRPLVKEIRTVGFVDYDQSRQSRIVTRVAGYLDRLYVDKSFQSVVQGEPLALVYSPELYSTKQEMVLALDRGAGDEVEASAERLKLFGVGPAEINAIKAAQQLIAALGRGDAGRAEQARQRLAADDRTPADIAAIEKTRKPDPGLVIRSPVSGHVISKVAEQGAHVAAGDTLFEVADLSTVWVEAEIYEADIPLLRADQEAEVTAEGLPNRVFHGRIVLVHPHVEMTTRTNRVRIEFPNPGHALRPGMYADVKIRIPYREIEPFKSVLAASATPHATDDASLIAFQKTCPVTGIALGKMGPPIKQQVRTKTVFLCCPDCIAKFAADSQRYLKKLAPPPADGVLTVPESAVIDTGTMKVVYLEREPGVFDGVQVELGPRSGDSYPVVKGLAVGDRVAAAGAFLIDAETRLNPTAATYVGASGGPSEMASTSDRPRTANQVTAGGADSSSAPPVPPQASEPGPAGKSLTLVLEKPDADALKNLDKLSPADRAAAIAQQNCPITHAPLGEMGIPVKVELTPGVIAFLCCDGCRKDALADPQKTLEKLAAVRRAVYEQTHTK